MAAQFSAGVRGDLRTPFFRPGLSWSRRTRHFRVSSSPRSSISSSSSSSSSTAANGDSYLDMWKKAMERERKSREFQYIAENSGRSAKAEEGSLGRKADLFSKIQEVPRDERDHIQRLQVIDRAAAAIAAARALIKEAPPRKSPDDVDSGSDGSSKKGSASVVKEEGLKSGKSFASEVTLGQSTPGPDFWLWSPPLDDGSNSKDVDSLNPARKFSTSPKPSISLMDKEKPVNYLAIPFQSTLKENEHSPPLPPLQSLVEVEKAGSPTDLANSADERKLEELFSGHAAEAAEALGKSDQTSSHDVNKDGSRWWKETGVEVRSDGVVCKWTLTRGVNADGAVEWEDKYWEAADQYDYKELGSEKSGRDVYGNVWREFWKESMWQDLSTRLVHIEKTADKWGKSGRGDEWHEKWWEHYDASGESEKWAHKWCSIDPNTQLDAGHAHVWHERWGEKYDGKGGSVKYTDKWAERSEGDGWSKWGDKWDEHFNSYGQGVKQGETWWEGKFGERWNRTWGEGHNGSGWIHKYGKSSSGEHWDTHEQQDTWYERYPHYGFDLCLKNSQQLRAVQKPPEKL